MEAAGEGYLTYAAQVDLLGERGMDIGDRDDAQALLRRVNYYRLSAYWYPVREIVEGQRQDSFYPETKLSDAVQLRRPAQRSSLLRARPG